MGALLFTPESGRFALTALVLAVALLVEAQDGVTSVADRNATAELHLQRMVFVDGSALSPSRRRDVYALTSPGSLSVFLCSNFRKLTEVNRAAAANILIHEMLHSLGAGEAPSPGLPTAYEITNYVELRCGS